MKKKLPLSRALIWIFFSILVISGSATLFWLYLNHKRISGSKDAAYAITGIIQTGPAKEQLPSELLLELLELSEENPQNLVALDLQTAKNKLLASPWIRSVRLKKIPPGTLRIDYCVRKPIAKVGSQENLGIDGGGNRFPLQPYLSGDGLPTVWLKSEAPVKRLLNALRLFQHPRCTEVFTLLELDLTDAESESFGKRQVVAKIEMKDGTQRLLRLAPPLLKEALGNYLRISDIDSPIIDLRLTNIALVAAQQSPEQLYRSGSDDS